MKRAKLVPMILLLTLCGLAVVGCERAVVGETYEGQRAGGRSLEVTANSPPRGAMTGAPEVPPPSQREWSVRESDPSIRGQLAAAGARIPFREVPRPRPVVVPPAPAPMPAEPPAVIVPPAPAPAAPQIVRPVRALAPRPAPPSAPDPAPAAPDPAPAAQP